MSGWRLQGGYSALQSLTAVVLLCVLVAVVIRAFWLLMADAELLQVKATSASLRTSLMQAREQWFVSGRRPGRLEGFADNQLLMSEAGWPVAVVSASGRQNEENMKTRCQALWLALLREAESTAGGSDALQNYEASGDGDHCYYRFMDRHHRLDATAQIEYDMSTGHVILTIR